jgi:hypothetical protein
MTPRLFLMVKLRSVEHYPLAQDSSQFPGMKFLYPVQGKGRYTSKAHCTTSALCLIVTKRRACPIPLTAPIFRGLSSGFAHPNITIIVINLNTKRKNSPPVNCFLIILIIISGSVSQSLPLPAGRHRGVKIRFFRNYWLKA